MKNFLRSIFIITLCIFGYLMFKYYIEDLTSIIKKTEEKSFIIDKYTIFGTHLNINGCIDANLDGKLTLILKNNIEEINLESIFSKSDNKTCFKTSNNNNNGIYLDKLKSGNFVFLVKQVDNDKVSYYNLKNNTDYDNLEYYTITRNNKNNKIDLKFDKYNDKEYLNINIKQTNLPKEIYDITIDPGHGGRDTGASYKLDNKVYTESEITLKISLLLKKDLEKLGLKVKLTRDTDIKIDNYGENGRAVIPNITKSKYSLSIHINSSNGVMNYGGVEVYIPNDIDYTLAKLFADNIKEIVGYSNKPTNRVLDGVYFEYFTSSDIEESKKDSLKQGLKPYNIKLKSPYMFMIREVGGINTYAYVDGRNTSHGINKFYNSNQTAEPYLIELGYINYEKDLENLYSKSELFSKLILEAIKEYLKISH